MHKLFAIAALRNDSEPETDQLQRLTREQTAQHAANMQSFLTGDQPGGTRRYQQGSGVRGI